MCNFWLRCIMAAKTEKDFNNFMRNTRYKRLELEYDLNVLNELYQNKEAENKKTLSDNLKSLKEEYDGLWLKFKRQSDDNKKRMEELFEKRKIFYEEKIEKLEEKIERLEIKRVEIEHTIQDLQNGKYKDELEKIEKYVKPQNQENIPSKYLACKK